MTYQDYCDIAALSWHIVKDANDPEFTKCAADHQSKLAYKVQSVHATGARDDQFDHHAAQMLAMPRDEWVNYVKSCDESKRLMADLEARTAATNELTRYPAPRTAGDITPRGISPMMRAEDVTEKVARIPVNGGEDVVMLVEKHARHGDEILLAERGPADSEDLPAEPKSKSVKPKKGKK